MVDYTPYAQALFELAQDSKQEMAWMSELKQVAQVITSVPELSQDSSTSKYSSSKEKGNHPNSFRIRIRYNCISFLACVK